MSTQFNGPGSFLANAAVSAFRAVALSDNRGIGLNPNNAIPFGFTQQDKTSGDFVTVKFFNDAGTQKCALTAAPVTIGDVLFAAANGAVAPTGTVTIGRSLTTAATNGSIVELKVLP
jgi:acetyltransferase-like isoleucine patch superfamily enzyme